MHRQPILAVAAITKVAGKVVGVVGIDVGENVEDVVGVTPIMRPPLFLQTSGNNSLDLPRPSGF